MVKHNIMCILDSTQWDQLICRTNTPRWTPQFTEVTSFSTLLHKTAFHVFVLVTQKSYNCRMFFFNIPRCNTKGFTSI